MGALLSFKKSNSADQSTDIFVDFENAKPRENELNVYAAVDAILSQRSRHLDTIRNYKGCSEFIRKAISSPSAEADKEAWEALTPCVLQLKEFYDYSQKMAEAIPILLKELSAGDTLKNIENCQALSKQFGDILDFVLQFDEQKMSNSNIQNDFSFYRRTLSKLKPGNELLKNVVVKDELANKLSLFYAYPTPMLRTVIDTISDFMKQSGIPPSNVTECLSAITAACLNTVTKKLSVEIRDYCLRVMVSCIILYDHVHLEGAFCKTSPIGLKTVVKTLEEDGKQSGLMNALKFSTKHLNDETTPKATKALFL